MSALVAAASVLVALWIVFSRAHVDAGFERSVRRVLRFFLRNKRQGTCSMKCSVVNMRNVGIGELTILDHSAESIVAIVKNAGLGFDLDFSVKGNALATAMITPKPAMSKDIEKSPHVVILIHSGIVEEAWVEPNLASANRRLYEALSRHLKFTLSPSDFDDAALRNHLRLTYWDFAITPCNRECKILTVPVIE